MKWKTKPAKLNNTPHRASLRRRYAIDEHTLKSLFRGFFGTANAPLIHKDKEREKKGEKGGEKRKLLEAASFDPARNASEGPRLKKLFNSLMASWGKFVVLFIRCRYCTP